MEHPNTARVHILVFGVVKLWVRWVFFNPGDVFVFM